MCLGIPGRVVKRLDDGLARVDVSGVRRDVSVAFTPEVEPGDWVLVHVGFALARIDEEEAQATLDLLAEAIAAELETPPEPSNSLLLGERGAAP
jgi:hydrogenase expression/formation protein HypC